MPTSFSITQNIPVSNHVYKYLVKRLGGNHITATRNSFIGSLFISLHSRNSDVEVSDTQYEKCFKIDINEHHLKENGLNISKRTAQLFNDQIDKMFREELFAFSIINKVHDKKVYLKSIRAFLDTYNITESDIKLDTLYRDFKRKKPLLEENLIST